MLLVLSAALFEAFPVLEALKNKGIDFAHIEIGVGPIHAAIATANLIDKAKDKNVIVIGSAGTFDSFNEPYLFQVDKVWWLPTGERLGYAKYMPNFYPPIHLAKNSKFNLPYRQIITSTSVSYQPGFIVSIEDLPNPDLLVENMEAYAIVKNLQGHCKSIDFLLGVSNAIGPNASMQWQQNWKKVADLTGKFISDSF